MGLRNKANKKKVKSKKLGLSLIIPCSIAMNQSKLSTVLLGVRESGLVLKNVFNEGIAAVGGLLFTKADNNEIDEIRKLNLSYSIIMMYILIHTF